MEILKKLNRNKEKELNLKKWEAYYQYGHKVMDEYIDMFVKQDEKINSLLLFHSIVIVLLSLLISVVVKNIQDSCMVINVLLAFTVFGTLILELVCIHKLLLGVSYKEIEQNNNNRDKMCEYWENNDLESIYCVRGNDALNSAKRNEKAAGEKIKIIGSSIELSKKSVILLIIIASLLFVQTGERIMFSDDTKSSGDGNGPGGNVVNRGMIKEGEDRSTPTPPPPPQSNESGDSSKTEK